MAFELIFAFDEVISLGHKENVTIAQVKQYVEMESHEERMHKRMIESKINDSKDLMKRKANEIEKNKIEKGRGGKGNYVSSMSSMSSRFDNSFEGTDSSMGGGVRNNSTSFGSGLDYDTFKPPARVTSTSAPSKGGMQLGKSTKANQFLESLKAEGEVIVEDVAPGPVRSSAALPISSDPIMVGVEENLVVVLKKDGGLENLEVQGNMSLVVQKEEDAYIRVQVESSENSNFNFKTHPNIDKNLYSEKNVLGLKDSSRPFPTGNPLDILKWRMQSKQDSMAPLSINCWPSVSGGESYVNIEYEASRTFELQNVVIRIPLPAIRDVPAVNQVDGEWRYDSRNSVLEWSITLIDNSNRSGSMEFVVPAADPNSFFPIDVKFTSNKTFCDLKVGSVIQTQSGNSVKFGKRTQLVVDSYQVV